MKSSCNVLTQKLRVAIALIALGWLMPACMQTENSSTLDATQYTIGADESGDSNYAGAMAVLKTNCTPCHAFNSMTDAQFISDGYVVKGAPASSKIYLYLRGNDAGSGAQSMPQSSTLSAGDIATLKAWITNMP